MANILEFQGGTYHIKLAVPVDVQKAFGRRLDCPGNVDISSLC